MGRLLKRQTDQIRRMHKEGYTQKEIGEAVGCSVRSVRNYLGDSPSSLSLRLEDLEKQLAEKTEEIKAVGTVLLMVWISIGNKGLWCPGCERFSSKLGDDLVWECHECGHKVGPIQIQ